MNLPIVIMNKRKYALTADLAAFLSIRRQRLDAWAEKFHAASDNSYKNCTDNLPRSGWALDATALHEFSLEECDYDDDPMAEALKALGFEEAA